VYNSQGSMMLLTRNRALAEQISRDFQANPQSHEIVVHDTAARTPKRR